MYYIRSHISHDLQWKWKCRTVYNYTYRSRWLVARWTCDISEYLFAAAITVSMEEERKSYGCRRRKRCFWRRHFAIAAQKYISFVEITDAEKCPTRNMPTCCEFFFRVQFVSWIINWVGSTRLQFNSFCWIVKQLVRAQRQKHFNHWRRPGPLEWFALCLCMETDATQRSFDFAVQSLFETVLSVIVLHRAMSATLHTIAIWPTGVVKWYRRNSDDPNQISIDSKSKWSGLV